jgi:prophage antirepressor-like protein
VSNIVPFVFEGHNVTVIKDDDGALHFVAMEVAGILGYSDAFEMTKRLDEEEKQNRQIAGFGNRGVTVISESGLYDAILGSNKPEAKPFQKWVRAEVLPSIRKTGTYTAKSVTTPLKATAEAAKAFAPLVRVARLLGCDRNAAAISANQAIYSMTNINLMQQLGHTHIEAEKQDHWYTPTELGKQMTPAVSARQVNLLLAEAGLQFKRGDVWEASDAGKDFARIYDTGKRHGSGVPVTQMKWSHTAVAVLQALPAENKEAA